MSKVYYAHSQLTYNTPREDDERAHLESLGHTVVCPNRDIQAKGKKDYQLQANTCDMIVCSEFMGFVGRGVASQVQDSLIKGVPVKVIRTKVETPELEFELLDVLELQMVETERDWKVRYATLVVSGDGGANELDDSHREAL